MSDILGAVSGILKLIPWILSAWKALRKRRQPPSRDLLSSSEAVVERFIALFESHGVHRSQIPLFFGHGLSLASVSNNQLLLSALTDQILDDAAKLFGIHPEWLYGATDQIYETHDFYKHPEKFAKFLQDLISTTGKSSLECYAITSDKIDWTHNNGLILIAERVGEINERPIFRYHLCDNWNMAYWKSHVDMYACLAIAYQHEVYQLGRRVTKEWMRKHVAGFSLFSYRAPDGIDIPERGNWWPDQVIDDPDLFLEGVDNEEQVHSQGHYLAIDRWLSYCAAQDLKIYDEDLRPKVTEAFKRKLDLLAVIPSRAQTSSFWQKLKSIFREYLLFK